MITSFIELVEQKFTPQKLFRRLFYNIEKIVFIV